METSNKALTQNLDEQQTVLHDIRAKVSDDVYKNIRKALEFSRTNYSPAVITSTPIISYEGVCNAIKS